MNNPHVDKANAQKERAQAEILELKAKLKEAGADARITIQEKIDEVSQKLQSL